MRGKKKDFSRCHKSVVANLVSVCAGFVLYLYFVQDHPLRRIWEWPPMNAYFGWWFWFLCGVYNFGNRSPEAEYTRVSHVRGFSVMSRVVIKLVKKKGSGVILVVKYGIKQTK